MPATSTAHYGNRVLGFVNVIQPAAAVAHEINIVHNEPLYNIKKMSSVSSIASDYCDPPSCYFYPCCLHNPFGTVSQILCPKFAERKAKRISSLKICSVCGTTIIARLGEAYIKGCSGCDPNMKVVYALRGRTIYKK